MNILVICKRRYTNRDLLADRFGRLYQLPVRWSRRARVEVLCVDYAGKRPEAVVHEGVPFNSFSAANTPWGLLGALRAIDRRARDVAPDVVVASGDLIVGLAARYACRHAGAAFVFDVYDDYRDFPAMRWSGLGAAFRPLCRAADGVLAASPALADTVRLFNGRVQVVPNGYDPAVFHPGERDAARVALGVDAATRLVVFTGSLDARFDMDTVRGAFSSLHARDPRVRLALVGAGSHALADAPWAITSPPVSQVEVARWIQASDLCLAPYRDVPLARTASPCKLAEYMACGRPVLTVDFPEFAGYLASGAGTYRAGDAVALAGRVEALLANPGDVSPMSSLAWDEIARESYDFVASLAGPRRPAARLS